MLFIENIDDNSIRFGNAVGGGTNPITLPKTLLARKDEIERIWISHTQNNQSFLNCAQVSEINLDGTVYATAELFVIAFNTLVSAGGSGGGSVTPSIIEYDTPGVGEVTNDTLVLAAGTVHSLTVTCTSGQATVTINGVAITIDYGQTMSWDATDVFDKDITIDTTGSVTDSVDYNFIGARATTTTTTTVAATTTTTTV